MSRTLSLPNFLVVGAAKAGTTALHDHLRQHPQVFVTSTKETNFFALHGTRPSFGGPRGEILNSDAVWRYEDYANLFADVGDERAIGEVCPRYLFTPGTAARIARWVPDMRIVAVLRHPAERAFSSYSMYRRDGFEPAATLAEAMDDEPRRLDENWAYAIHVRYGFYGRQLQEYFDVFPANRILCLLYEDYIANPGNFFTRLFAFIGVDADFMPNTSRRHNRSGMIRNPLLRALWTRTHAIRGAAPLLPKPVRRRVASYFTSLPMDPLPFPPETRQRLNDLYRDDIVHLQGLINRDLSRWLEAPATSRANSERILPDVVG